MSTIWNASSATAVAAIQAYVDANLIGINEDGQPYLKREQARAWLISEFNLVFADAKALPSNEYGIEDAYGNPPAEMDGMLDRLEIAYSPEKFRQHASWPLSTASQSKDELVAQVSKLQVDAARVTKEIVIRYEELVKDLRPAIETWFQANVLNLAEDEPGAFKAGVTRVIDSRAYVATYVSDWGWESAPSDASAIVDVDQNDSASVVVAAGPSGRSITKVRLYRSEETSGASIWRFVKEASHTGSALTIVDDLKESQLGGQCTTFGYLEPPADLTGLIAGHNGQLAGFARNTVYFCEPSKPWAWPAAYDTPVQFPIVGLGMLGQAYFVGTRANPTIISGADPASMSPSGLKVNQACVSKRGIVSTAIGVIYPSPDGLCLADGSGVKVLTLGAYSKQDWEALNPASIFAVEHDGCYYAFYDNGAKGCIVFDLASEKISTLSVTATAAFVDKMTDALYVAAGTSIIGVHRASAPRTGRWRSKRFRLDEYHSFAWLAVDTAITAQPTIRIYSGGSVWCTVILPSQSVAGSVAWGAKSVVLPIAEAGKPVRLPAGRINEVQIECETSALVRSIVLAGSTDELQSVTS